MPKINQEEYEVLKELYGKWKWIARDEDSKKSTFPNELWLYEYKPQKSRIHWLGEGGATKRFGYDNLFQFIKHKDSKPYNIAELIEEYEDSKEYKDSLVIEYFMDKANESEEAEVRKEKIINGLRTLRGELANNYKDNQRIGFIAGVNRAIEFIHSTDEPEVLTQEWIDENKTSIDRKLDGTPIYKVREELLQNLLVPKQEEVEEGRVRLIVGFDGGTESYYATDIGDALDFLTDYDARFTVSKEPVIPQFVAEWISERNEIFDLYPALKRLENSALSWEDVYEWYRKNTSKFVNAYLTGKYEVEKEQKYYVVKREGLDGVHYYFTKFDDEMNSLFTIPNDKKGAYRFDDKEKAQAIANYTNSKVEELEE